ncbi:Pup--protein ligase [Micrococcoides hystricis]|uniref:Pup--protein ligase n=1 Tax=Micrococcoides hystricis TaxID=1572761 RepID=A0ABV6P7A2_9MICC
MKRRVYGVETEFGINYHNPDAKPLTPEEVARYLFKPVVRWGRSSNVFIPNGARLYLDVGSHPEYATAECDNLLDLIAQDKAGEWIFSKLVAQAQQAMAEDGFHGRVFLLKNNTDSKGNSFGSHENYLIPRKTEYRRLTEILIPFLVTRQFLAGAGRVVPATEEQPAHFSFSQRADFVLDAVSSATTRSRPIINTRDEPHADASLHRRLHVIVGDSNMSETTQLLRFGSTEIILRMIEEGVIFGDKRIANPIRAIQELSHDMTGQTLIQLATGETISGLDLQEFFLEKAKSFIAKEGPHHEHVEPVLELWEKVLTAVRSEDYSSIETDIDWAIKHKLLVAYQEKHGLDWADPRIRQLDFTYHDIDPARGLFNVLQARGQATRVLTDSDIGHAMEHAPATTRAALRGRFVNETHARGEDINVDWVHMRANNKPIELVLVKDPFQTESEKMDRLIELLGEPDPDYQHPDWLRA